MRDESYDFLKRLLSTPGPSGYEDAVAGIWRGEAGKFAGEVKGDRLGNSFATLNGGGSPKIMLSGHVDEIGLMVTHVDGDGFLHFSGVGGWDPQVLVGQRVLLQTKNGEVPGVIGKKAIHVMEPEERRKASTLKSLWIDIGAKDGDEAKERVRVGDVAVVDQPFLGAAERAHRFPVDRQPDRGVSSCWRRCGSCPRRIAWLPGSWRSPACRRR